MLTKDGNKFCTFKGYLSKIVKDANNFTKELTSSNPGPHQFCLCLRDATDGGVTTTSEDGSINIAGRKRPHEVTSAESGAPGKKQKSTNKVKKPDDGQGAGPSSTEDLPYPAFQNDFSDHQIGNNRIIIIAVLVNVQ